MLTDFLLCGIVFFEVFERLFKKEVEPFGLEVHFFTNGTSIFFIAFFMVGDLTRPFDKDFSLKFAFEGEVPFESFIEHGKGLFHSLLIKVGGLF